MKKIAFTFLPVLLVGIFCMPVNIMHAITNVSPIQEQSDGPYVFYNNDQIIVKYIQTDTNLSKIDSVNVSQKSGLILFVNTDKPGVQFQVKLKEKLENEKSTSSAKGKMLVMSDIEGNFAGFRKLLQANGVIDSSFNWVFGDGQLILSGDFFDRGNQVTEVLWLIYSLEEKAKAAGGYVHFILGNHEIMNLSNDIRYVNAKYFAAARTLHLPYQSLYDDRTELGRWLRTKNVMEKVGNILFLHGGVSSFLNQTNLSLNEINKLARPFYADTIYKYPDPKIDLLYSDLGPFWYRGYYTKENKATQQTIDSTLDLFRVRHIAIGHTIVADTISVWYNGKVIDTDVHHAEGFSEALLVEDGKLYRVNPLGEKFFIGK